MLSRRLAWSFMKRKDSALPSFTTVFSVLGVAFGVAAFLVVVTVFDSFETELKRLLSAANPHVIVFQFPHGIRDAEKVRGEILSMVSEPVLSTSLFEYNEALLTNGVRTASVVIRAIEGQNSAVSQDLDKAMVPKGALELLNHPYLERSQTPKMILGRGLALKLNVDQGDRITLSSAGFGLGGENHFLEFEVAGFATIGLAQYDDKLAYISFQDGQFLFGEKGTAKGIEIQLKNPSNAEKVSLQLQDSLPYSVRSLQELDRGLFEQVKRDGSAIRVIVLIIALVAAFNIIATLTLSVVDRSKQIAILRSFGASKILILKVFMTVGLTLGFCGGLLGWFLGWVILTLFSGFELGELQAFYFFEKVPVYFNFTVFGGAFAVALVLSFVSAIYPALKAVRVSPLYGIKKVLE